MVKTDSSCGRLWCWPRLATTTFGRRFSGQARSVTASRLGARWYNELTTPRPVQLYTHNLTVAMFVRRVASGLAKRAAFRPVAARPFSSSFARCKPLSKAHTIDMIIQTHPLIHQSTPTATPSPANTPTKSSPSRVRPPTPALSSPVQLTDAVLLRKIRDPERA